MITREQIEGAVTAVAALAEAIRELGSVPSGHLYAQVMSVLDIRTYEAAIRVLKGAGLVSEDGAHVLTWVGPQIPR